MELVGLGGAAGLCLCTIWLAAQELRAGEAAQVAASPPAVSGPDAGEAARRDAKGPDVNEPALRDASEPAMRDGGLGGDRREGPPDSAPRVPAPRVSAGLMLREDRSADAGPRLRSIDGGRLVHEDGRFTATIAADGSVRFKDVLVKPKVVVVGLDVLTGKADESQPRDAFAERAVYPFGPSTAAMIGGGGGMPGLADLLIGTRHAAAKTRFLRATEALRMRMAHAWLRQQLDAQLGELVPRMLAIWRDPSFALAERRRRIFVAWDECEEASASLGSPAEALRGEVAMQARDRIERLVRTIAPPGSPQQFTPAELETLNAVRRSRRRFEPYAAGP